MTITSQSDDETETRGAISDRRGRCRPDRMLDRLGAARTRLQGQNLVLARRVACHSRSHERLSACRRRPRGPLDVGIRRQHIPLMTDPFVQPAEPSAAAAIEAINDELCLFDDWMDRYEFIIGMGRKLPPFPDDWANDAHRVPGCQSRVWMEAIPRDGKLYFAGLSDAAIVSGLVALLLRVYSGRSADEIIATDPVFLKDLGLLEALSTNRGNGIAAMARKVREVAAMQQAA
jgi:cysteine desulfuration protein SufE